MSFDSLFCLVIATAFTAIFIFAMFKGKKFDDLLENLHDSTFQLKELYTVGLAWSDMLPFLSYGSSLSDKIKPSIQMIYGDKYTEYYTRIYLAKIITFAHFVMTVLSIIGALLSGIMGVAFCIIGIIAGLFVAKIYIDEPKKKVEERADDCIIEFPNLVTKLALLLNAGTTLKEAWFISARSTNGVLKEMMMNSCESMENGKSDHEAISEFGTKSGSEEIRKFSMSVIQSMEKGNAELSRIMMQQSTELWSLKKQKMLQKGEKAATKLVVPTSLMFVGVIMVVLSCALTGLSI
ncbi:MAG: type II secretion system F family protein [Ruminococcus sp.]